MKIIVIGAGPASLSFCYNYLKNNKNDEIIILEKSNCVGGISRTEDYKGNKIDIGGHRFFTKDKEIINLWEEVMSSYNKKDFLKRGRLSRIYYKNVFFDYPVKFSLDTIKKLGFFNTILCGFSYFFSFFKKRKEDNLENLYINKFGKRLYSIFFKDYTKKVWGVTPDKISSLWGNQRVKGLNIKELLKNYFFKKSDETSLIDHFYYPKYGPGQLYNNMLSIIEKMGGKIIYNANVNKLYINNNHINFVKYNNIKVKCDYVISSMPLKDLFLSLNKVDNKYLKIAKGLPYRDFITCGVLLKKLNLNNLNDNWIYIQDSSVMCGRIQIFNNWSPYMVKNKNNIWIGLEFFCNENDNFWNLSDNDIKQIAINELIELKFILDNDVLDSCVIRCKKAYPAYFGTFDKIDVLKDFLFKIDNLYCIGRNGQHRYNNMDHSMKTGIIASNQLLNRYKNDNILWNVNVEEVYHEKKD